MDAATPSGAAMEQGAGGAFRGGFGVYGVYRVLGFTGFIGFLGFLGFRDMGFRVYRF